MLGRVYRFLPLLWGWVIRLLPLLWGRMIRLLTLLWRRIHRSLALMRRPRLGLLTLLCRMRHWSWILRSEVDRALVLWFHRPSWLLRWAPWWLWMFLWLLPSRLWVRTWHAMELGLWYLPGCQSLWWYDLMDFWLWHGTWPRFSWNERRLFGPRCLMPLNWRLLFLLG